MAELPKFPRLKGN